MSGPTVLKLGGSVITRKDEPETIDEDALERATAAVGASTGDMVLVHGGGSFGHHHADRYGVTVTDGTHDGEAIYAIHRAMRRLNDAVIERLHDRDVPAVPVHPFSAAARDRAGELALPTRHLEVHLAEGFLPVTHGDVIGHVGAGATILSGDELVVALAEALDAARVGVCSGVPGVFGPDGEVLRRIGSYEDVAAALGGSDATDVTGGMAGKVRALLDLSMPAHVFDIDGLAAFLSGDAPGTTVERA